MANINKSDVAKMFVGVLLVSVGVAILVAVVLVVTSPPLISTVLQWLRSYPIWSTLLLGLVVSSLGAFLAVTEHINSAKKAHETDNDSYQERS
jgi:hypothetical protein